MSRRALLASVILGATLTAAPAWAQFTGTTPTPSAPRPVATVIRAGVAPTIDGALDEEVWHQAEPLTSFTQAEPDEGQPASELTEVWVAYDDTALYIGASMHDRDSSQIVVSDTSRDAPLADQDSFQVILDTFQDRQNGFVFGTNVTGIQMDAQVRNEGAPSTSWDASWDVKTQRNDSGWTAEFRIPLRTLRYGAPPQAWGVNFMRNIRRTRERAYWAPMPRQFTLSRLSSAGNLRGLQLAGTRNFKLLPYAIGSANNDYKPGAEADFNREVGIDAKIGVSGSMNLDLTVNTDFAQVEVDTQQINLTRYNLRFPEKRPFFLENAGLFQIGASTSSMNSSGDLDLFFSRRIGIDEDGLLVPIKGGARLSGKASGFNIGLMNMQTESIRQNPANNFTAARVSRDLPSRSGVGLMFLNRSATSGSIKSDDWNRTWGLDGRYGLGERVTVGGFGARTETPGLTGRQYAWNMVSQYDDGKTLVDFDYGKVGEDFNPEVGYLENTLGYRRWYFRIQETMRQEKIRSWGFREFLPHINYTRYDYLDDTGPQSASGLQSGELHIDNHWDWENGFFISTALNGTWEGLDKPFEVDPGIVVPAGQHGGPRFTMRSNTDRRKQIYLRHQWDAGAFLTGTQNTHSLQAIIRQAGTFVLDSTWTYRGIDLPQGSFSTNLGNMRVTYNLKPTVFVQSLIQYNDRTERWSTNLRFTWLQTAGTGFFVVYNDTESLDGIGPVNRAFIVKYVHQFDLLR